MTFITRGFGALLGTICSVVIRAPAEDVFGVVSDVGRWSDWLMRVPCRVSGGDVVGLGTIVDVPLENFWGTPLGVATAFASLSRTYPYGRASGEMQVTDFLPGRKIEVESRRSPIHLRISFEVTPIDSGAELVYKQEYLGWRPVLWLVSIPLMPVALVFLAVLQLARPIFDWAMRRRLHSLVQVLDS